MVFHFDPTFENFALNKMAEKTPFGMRIMWLYKNAKSS